MIRSPLFIRVALHYYYSPEPWPEPSPAANDVHMKLRDAGLIEEFEGPDNTTCWAAAPEPLQVYVEALGSVPLPVKKWVMPEQEEG